MSLQTSGGCLASFLAYDDQSLLCYVEAHPPYFIREWLPKDSRVHYVSRTHRGGGHKRESAFEGTSYEKESLSKFKNK